MAFIILCLETIICMVIAPKYSVVADYNCVKTHAIGPILSREEKEGKFSDPFLTIYNVLMCYIDILGLILVKTSSLNQAISI